MKHPETPVKFINNGYLLWWYDRAVFQKDEAFRWELVTEMARRVYPKGEMMPNISTVVADFRHWKCNGAQEEYA